MPDSPVEAVPTLGSAKLGWSNAALRVVAPRASAASLRFALSVEPVKGALPFAIVTEVVIMM